jgi:hypothetical protein
LETALKIMDNAPKSANVMDLAEIGYDLANSLGVAFARMKNNLRAISAFQKAHQYAKQATGRIIIPDPLSPKKYWPALIRALTKKISILEKLPVSPVSPASPGTPTPPGSSGSPTSSNGSNGEIHPSFPADGSGAIKKVE